MLFISHKKYGCNECPKKYTNKEALVNHLKKVHGNVASQDIKCPFCDLKFHMNTGTNHNIYTHLKNLHETEQESHLYQEIVTEYMSNKIMCQTCGNSYASSNSLATHMENMHKPAEFAPCEVCGKSIRQNTTTLNSHMKLHTNETFICTECGSTFAKKSYLTRHMLRHNTTPFPCPECGRLFTTIMKLSRHKRHVHLGIRNFQCEHCVKRFQDSRKLNMHIRSVHTKEKPFGCDMCEFKCARIDNLNLHRRKTHGVMSKITRLELEELKKIKINDCIENNYH